MGDGNIYPQMDHAVEIECTSCHGTYNRVSRISPLQPGPPHPEPDAVRGDDVLLGVQGHGQSITRWSRRSRTSSIASTPGLQRVTPLPR